MTLTVTDLFCGAGGSSSGAEQVPGVTVRMAANHWKLAVETHNTNLPHADHDCAEISQVDPRRYPRTDLLWASPECTNHSQARGKRREDAQADLFDETLPDAAAERSRATMWDVVRFTEHARYRAVVVENVIDAWQWAPFRAWLLAMDSLGYDHETVFLNSMHAQAAGRPAPQSRDRMYVVFWRKGGRRPDLKRWTSPAAWCPSCQQTVWAVQSWKRLDRPRWGRYRSQYLYRCPRSQCRHAVVEPGWLPAAAAIDWTLPGERIGDRAKPLAGKTRRRIEAGLAKYARPVTLEAAGNTFERRPGVRCWPADAPLTTLTTTATKALAYDPLLVPVEGRDGKHAAPATDALRTQTARNETALLVPAGGTWNDDAASTEEPFRTRTTRDTEALVVPLRQNNTAKDAGWEPLDTVAAAGNHHALVGPFITVHRSRDDQDLRTSGIDEPLGTLCASGNHQGVVQPAAMVMRNNGSTGDGGEHCTSPEEVLRTLTAAGHQSLVRWGDLVVDYNGPARRVADPLPTQTTVEGDGLLGPAVDVDSCYFRMLEPHEIAAAMAFAEDYVILGNKRERVRQAGNAVTPPAARDLIAAVVESLTGQDPTG